MRIYAVALLALAAMSSAVHARDFVLVIGGGFVRNQNQASLEKNVLFFERLLAAQRVAPAHRAVYFADGADERPDLQVRDAASLPRANQLMAEFFGEEDGLGLYYRNHAIAGVRGSTNKANIARWFAEVGPTMRDGDRLILYVTAHGQRSDERDDPYATAISLWNNEQLRVRELVRMLDQLPSGVSVTAIMVQCYTGGFARFIYNDADPEKGLSSQPRCGFFATVHDRVAAGCTPEVDKASYVEYSSYFWEALGGRTQTGEPIAPPDYDGDGRTSLAEAHAYTVLNADTIDLPLTASGEFLSLASQFADAEHPDLLAKNTAYDTVLALAAPAERAVLEGLSAELGLEGVERLAAAEEGARESRRFFRRGGRGRGGERRAARLRETIARDLEERWPELANPFNPGVVELLTTRSAEFVAAVEGHPSYAEYRELAEADVGAPDPQKRRVKFERFTVTAENVILRENLRRLGDAAKLAQYEAIAAAENATLSRTDTP